MKKRKGTWRRKLARKLAEKAARPRRAWIIETLEDRCYFAGDTNGGIQWQTVSSDTAEGQALIKSLASMWAAQSSNVASLSAAPNSVTDPYFVNQWHLFNGGQVVNPGQFQNLYGVPGEDINVIPAWNLGFTGAGVLVGVVDSQVEMNHPDLLANISQQFAWDAIFDQPSSNFFTGDSHGTAVAGLIGAVANNDLGGAGVAYGAQIVPIRMLFGNGTTPLTDEIVISALTAGGAPIDIMNHSWGPASGRLLAGPTAAIYAALEESILNGRGGLGMIHVFSAGNDAEMLASAGSNGFVNSRYTIAVGVVDHDGFPQNSDGTSTGYSEMSPAVLIVAPSASGPTDIINNFNTGSGLFTTDVTGDGGYNQAPNEFGVNTDIDRFPDADYTSRMGGTSGAAPLVSGVIALMLEANPNLSWRDVQEILVRSARQANDQDDSWITNLVPLFRDPLSGFGSNPNDTFLYRLVPRDGVRGNQSPLMVEPSEQAISQEVTLTSGNTIQVEAGEDTDWDGAIGNQVDFAFRLADDDYPFVRVEMFNRTQTLPSGFITFSGEALGEIRITIPRSGATTWGDIQEALVDAFGSAEVTDPESGETVEVPAFGITMLDSGENELDLTDVEFDIEDLKVFSANDLRLFGGVDTKYKGVDDNPLILERVTQYQTFHPFADPITSNSPQSLYTNGAGYTVSHGRADTSEYGYAHGVVNAELAVQLALQWHTKNQNLPSEKTFLVGGAGGSVAIRAARNAIDAPNHSYIIPGGLSNSPNDFAAYFQEFFKTPTFTQGEDGEEGEEGGEPTPPTPGEIDPKTLPFGGDNPPGNSRGVYRFLDVPLVDPVSGSSNLMSMESVEIQLNITGDANAMDFLRVTLVSPDGTHSELTLNQYRPGTINNGYQNVVSSVFGDPAGALTEDGSMNWVYTTNRIWGERSDSKPLFDDYAQWDEFSESWVPTYQGNQIFAGLPTNLKGWELHFENYSGSDLQLNGASVAFHGSPIGSSFDPIERVMGKVGVDQGRYIPSFGQVLGANDGEFNFDRYLTTTSTSGSFALDTTNLQAGFSQSPYGSYELRYSDQYQEGFGSNITVYAYDNILNQRVAEFVTGYDGNYYFDLPNNDRQATSGTLQAASSTVTISATKNGGLSGALGNDINVNFIMDSELPQSALAFFNGDELTITVRDTNTTWSQIKSAVESITNFVYIDGEPLNVKTFDFAVSNLAGTFTAADTAITGTLVGGIDGTYTLGIEDPQAREVLAGSTQATAAITATNAAVSISATETGRYRNSMGNGINVQCRFDIGFTDADALYDSSTKTLYLYGGPTVTWGEIKEAVEAIGLDGSAGLADFSLTVSDPDALFAATDEGLTASLGGGQFRNYDSEWTIRIDHTDAFTREAATIDPVTGKITYLNNLNFLLDSPVVAGSVEFSGQVLADVNGDGIRGADDIGVGEFMVYGDLNHSGGFELGEPFVFTDPDGNYEFTIPAGKYNTFTISVLPPSGWMPTAPASGKYDIFANLGDEITVGDFLFKPPGSPSGIGNGSIFGYVFNDLNSDRVQQVGQEAGVAGRTVYIDLDSSGTLSEGDISTVTNSTGAYVLANVPQSGTYQILVVVNEPYVLTAPQIGYHSVTLAAGKVITGMNFGLHNLATHDYGDLISPNDGYKTYGPDGARHFVVPGFQLGSRIDGEVRSRVLVESPPNSGNYVPLPSSQGNGDDQEVNDANFDDEDGVTLVGGVLYRGENTLSITVSGIGGYLQGWIDFNQDGTFSADERIFNDLDLNPGTYSFTIQAPLDMEEGQVAARFRWGTGGMDYFGTDIIGEVEDYVFNTVASQAPVNGDFDGDRDVDNDDHGVWAQTYGSESDLRADASHDNVVNILDYVLWRMYHAAASTGAAAASATASSSSVEEMTASQSVMIEMAGPPLPVGPSLTDSFDQEPLGISFAAAEVATPVEATVSSTPLAGFFQIGDSTSSVFETSSSPVASSAVVGAVSQSDSLLLDQLWSDLGEEASDDDAIVDRFARNDDEEQSDLAVAVAFEDQSQWWGL